MPKNPFTEEEISYLRRNYKRKQLKEMADHLGRSKGMVAYTLHRLNLRKKKGNWTEAEVEFVAENLGRLSFEAMGKRLHRTATGIKMGVKHHLPGLNQHSNIYSASAVAEVLGIKCSKTVVAWKDRGYLIGRRAPLRCGDNVVWWFEYEDILLCLAERPWLVDPKKMPENYFNYMVRKEWEKNPWYTRKEAAMFVGVVTADAIDRYRRKGWIRGYRRPMGGSKGAWIFRHSELAEFQLHDPRPLHRKGVSLPQTLENDMARAEAKAWHQLGRGRFQMFGYWASVWTHLNSMNKRGPNPFTELMELARQKSNNGRR